MNVSRVADVGDLENLQGLLDRGPSWSVNDVDFPVGIGDPCLTADPSLLHRDKYNGQSCPYSHDVPNTMVTSEFSPCPCDRWCEFADRCLIDGALMNRAHPPTCLPHRQVRFAPQVEIFEFVENDTIDKFTLKQQVVVSHSPMEDMVDDMAPHLWRPDEMEAQHGAFWGFWHRSWLLHGVVSGLVDLDALDSLGGPSSCLPDLPLRQCRPETNPPLVLIAHPVDDANDFDIRLDEEPDHGHDIGVSFLRWQDIAEVVDLLPLVSAERIPFITFGLRNVPLGRRDFDSPDLSPTRLRDAIWHLWQDEVRQFEDISIHFVRPQPLNELACHGVIVLIVEILNDDLPRGVSPVLALTCDRHDRLLDTPQAVYVPQVVDCDELTACFGMAHLCTPNGFRQCATYAASSLVTAVRVPVAPGVLVKLVISAKLQIFAQAMDWFPDIERFAAMVRRNVRQGSQVHGFELHPPYHDSHTLQFRIADLWQPQAFQAQLANSCGFEKPLVFPLPGDLLDLANPMLGSHFHAMVLPGDGSIGATLVTVTQLLDQDGTVLRSCNQVVRRDDFLSLDALHQHLCGHFRFDPMLAYQFGCNGHVVDSLQSVSFATVLVHTMQQGVLQAPQSNVTDDDSGMSAVDETSEGSVYTDSLSLLQKRAVRGRSILLLQHNQQLRKIDVQSDVEDIERCDIVSAMPSHFASPKGWIDRRPYNLTGLSHDVEILVDPGRPVDSVDTLCECLYLGETTMVPQGLFVLRVSRLTTWDGLLEQLSIQGKVSSDEVESIRIDGSTVFHDTQKIIDDGAHCVVVIREPCSDGFCGSLIVEISGPVALPGMITTYVHDLQFAPRRFDVVGTPDPEKLLAKIVPENAAQRTLCWHQVKWDPNDLEPCRNLFLLDDDSHEDGLAPMLLVHHQLDGRQAWQVCHLPHDRVPSSLSSRFPDASQHRILIDGRDALGFSAIAAPGTCIFYDSTVGPSPGGEFPFTQGMQCLLDWLSTPSLFRRPVGQVVAFGNGEAPCPCDRWCADPAPSDPQLAFQDCLEPRRKVAVDTLSSDLGSGCDLKQIEGPTLCLDDDTSALGSPGDAETAHLPLLQPTTPSSEQGPVTR